MSTVSYEPLYFQISLEGLPTLRRIAKAEGRQFQTVLDEALRDYIERKEKGLLRRHVMDSFTQSLGAFDDLYRELANYNPISPTGPGQVQPGKPFVQNPWLCQNTAGQP
jgi:hypothetical protein